jgi:hypothetical protein
MWSQYTLWSRANICSLVSLSLYVLWSHCEAEPTSVVFFTMWSQYRQGQWHKTTDVGSASQCDHSTDKDNDTRLQMLALLHNVITVQTMTMTQDYRCWLITLWSRANICSLVSLSLSVLWPHCEAELTSVVLCHCPCLYCDHIVKQS